MVPGAQARATAVVVTYNRKELLIECLEALARQTHPLARVLLVDNASTDGTLELVESSGIASRLPLEYLRLARNGGGSEGFFYGVEEALQGESDWIWLMDDDCEPLDDCLERLLSSPRAEQPETGALVPQVRLPAGDPLPLHRGHIIRRHFRAPMQACLPPEYAQPETACDFASFVGPLFRTSVVREMGAPDREMFIRFEDLEYSARMAGLGYKMWLLNESVILHKEGWPVTATTLKAYWRHFSARSPFKEQWKNVYGLRNMVAAGRRHGFVSLSQALSYVAVQVTRTLLFDEGRLRMARLIPVFALDGRRERFRNVTPGDWKQLQDAPHPVRLLTAEALRYDEDVREPVRRLSGSGAVPSPAG
jgi:GT2 family glycosyltransferase